ncbi:leucine-rich_repeat domain-containing protein [Hexamita inflata]|uniref:Leucine-rich repeat domain-containing protein n=1 Tax=Hexamita inflata TaxID=28002 RepID=A0AA86TFH3_9EUKA|nr:leucine-rich repeat domain-containing protein [Hexamita inflata]
MKDTEQLTENELKFILNYKNQIQNDVLRVYSNYQLESIAFVSKLNISKLTIQYCINIRPLLHSETIKELTIDNCSINNIDDLQLENLEVLNLSGNNEMSQILNFSRFKNLKQLSLSNNFFSDISFLRDAKLTKLNLQESNLVLNDTTVLTSLLELKELSISYFRQSVDIQPLQVLQSSVKLNISIFYIKNLNFDNLIILPPLQELYISGCQGINVFGQLQNQKKLQKLHLISQTLENFNFLKQFTILKELNLSYSRISDLTMLQQMDQLLHLTVREFKYL